MNHFIPGKLIACDTETTGLDPWHGDRPFAFSFCNSKGVKKYFEWKVNPRTRRVKPKLKELRAMQRLFADPDVTKVFHNASFDVRMLEVTGIPVAGVIHDTTFAARVCNPLEKNYKLKNLAYAYLGIDAEDQDTLRQEVISLRRRAKDDGYTLGPAPDNDYWLPRHYNPRSTLCRTYAVLDAERTMLLWLMMRKELRELKVWNVYQRERRLFYVTYDMESRGVAVNTKVNRREQRYHQLRGEKELAFMQKEAWEGFNPNSPKQVVELLYTRLNLKVQKRTKTGNPSTDWDALSHYLHFPVVSAIARYRTHVKAVGSFFSNYDELKVKDPVVPGGFCIHARFHQSGAKTGRFSSSNPNLQNVSQGTKAGSTGTVPFSARKPFGPRPGYHWFLMDYKQLEARLFSYAAKEKFMMQAFLEGRDFHSECTNKCWGGRGNKRSPKVVTFALRMDTRGVYPDEPILAIWKQYKFAGLRHLETLKRGVPLPAKALKDSKRVAKLVLEAYDWDIVRFEKEALGRGDTRDKTKNMMFVRIFGGGPERVMEQLKCTFDEAKSFLDGYVEEFPRIELHIKEMKALVAKHGYITNMYGRRQILPDPRYSYRAVNYNIQSSAADLLKSSMIKAHRLFQDENIDAHILLTIHDELIFEINKRIARPKLIRRIQRLMEDSDGHIGIPTPVEVARAIKTWAEPEPLKEYDHD